MGPLELAFFVIAAAGPLIIVAGFAPLAFMLGGIGAPGAQLLTALVLLLFAVGLTRMALRIKNAGAFYSYIGQGLGRLLGGGAATLALMAYSCIAIGTVAAVGAFAILPLQALGLDIPWQVTSMLALATIAYLGHRRISLSAKVLGVVLLTEAVILLILAVPVLLQGGEQGFDLESFRPSTIFSGQAGAMFAICFGCFIGFESSAIYAEETRDPEKTVPRAIYLAVGFLGLFYTFMAWVIYLAYGGDAVVEAATADPVGLVFGAMEKYVGHGAVVVMEVLLVTSAFASALSVHNAAARYMFALGREKMLPRTLAVAHPAHHSPYIASGVQTALTVMVLAIGTAAGADPYLEIFLPMVAPGILAIILLQAVCSLAIVTYFNRVNRSHGLGVWGTTIAPMLSFIGLGIATWLVASEFDLLSGRTGWVNWVLFALLPVAFGVGFARAAWLRRTAPDDYERLTLTSVY